MTRLGQPGAAVGRGDIGHAERVIAGVSLVNIANIDASLGSRAPSCRSIESSARHCLAVKLISVQTGGASGGAPACRGEGGAVDLCGSFGRVVGGLSGGSECVLVRSCCS